MWNYGKISTYCYVAALQLWQRRYLEWYSLVHSRKCMISHLGAHHYVVQRGNIVVIWYSSRQRGQHAESCCAHTKYMHKIHKTQTNTHIHITTVILDCTDIQKKKPQNCTICLQFNCNICCSFYIFYETKQNQKLQFSLLHFAIRVQFSIHHLNL